MMHVAEGTLINRKVNIFPDPDKLHARCVYFGCYEAALLTRPPWNLKNPAPPLKPANATKIGRALHVARDAQVSLPPFVPCQQRVKDGFKYIYKKEREREKIVAIMMSLLPGRIKLEANDWKRFNDVFIAPR